MSNDKNQTGKSTDSKKEATLDEILTALQKSFSRVSAKTSEVPLEAARSMITGNIEFEVTLPFAPDGDKLRYKPGGDANAKFTGVVAQDIRAVHPTEMAEAKPELKPKPKLKPKPESKPSGKRK